MLCVDRIHDGAETTHTCDVFAPLSTRPCTCPFLVILSQLTLYRRSPLRIVGLLSMNAARRRLQLISCRSLSGRVASGKASPSVPARVHYVAAPEDSEQARKALDIFLSKASPAAAQDVHSLLGTPGRPPLEAILLDALRGDDRSASKVVAPVSAAAHWAGLLGLALQAPSCDDAHSGRAAEPLRAPSWEAALQPGQRCAGSATQDKIVPAGAFRDEPSSRMWLRPHITRPPRTCAGPVRNCAAPHCSLQAAQQPGFPTNIQYAFPLSFAT